MSAPEKDIVQPNIGLYGDGTGAIEVASNGSSSTTVTVTSEVLKKGQLYAGFIADIGTAANYDSKLTADPIVSVNPSAGTIVMTTASDLSSGGAFYITRSGNASSSTVNYELNNGLKKLINTSSGATVGGLSSTTYPIWDNQRDTAGGSLTEDRMIQLWNSCIQAGADISKLELLTSLGGLRQFYNLKVSQARYADPKVITGGFSTLEFSGSQLVADYEAPYGQLRYIDWSHIFEFSNSDFHFLDSDGDTWKWVSGIDAWRNHALNEYPSKYILHEKDQDRLCLQKDKNYKPILQVFLMEKELLESIPQKDNLFSGLLK